MSVATFQPPAAIYREEQNFAWYVYALLAAMVGLGWLGLAWQRPGPPAPAVAGHRWMIEMPLALAVGLVLPPVLLVGVLRMTTEVTPAECRVWFGWVPTYRRAIPIGGVLRVEVVRYRPWADCGGHGIRTNRDGDRVLSARGDRGVLLHLADGSRVLIGSQRPEDLARALEAALRPTV